jgi:multidrug efflux system outer membrane protein
MRRILGGLVCATLVTVAGCALGPSYERPEVPVPEGWVEPVRTDTTIADLPWWEVFADTTLQNLIELALVENKDLLTSAARIEEARANLGFTKADLYPRLDGSAGASRSKTSEQLPPLLGEHHNDFFLAADASWELDLWGKLRRATEAARGEYLATEEGYRALTLSLVSDVASLYFGLRDLDARLEISRRTLAGRQESTTLIRSRFEGGIAPELDLNQAEIEEAEAAASVASLDRQVIQTEYALSVLLGHAPGAIPRGRALTDQPIPPEIPAGLPSELLERRPDVLVAEQQLAAQTARIGVAQALRFPSLSLTGSYGLESNDLENITENGASFWNIGANLLGPIFNFGKNKAQVEVERARTEQLLHQYELAVLQGFREVEDALVAIRTFREEHAARTRLVTAAQNAVRLSRARYDSGFTNYLEVLDLERSLFSAELAASQTLQQQLVSVVQLYKALGGGWSPMTAEAEEPADEP